MRSQLHGRPNRRASRSPITLRAQQIGLTLNQLADRVGCARGTVENVACARQLPAVRHWARWALALELPLGDLVALLRLLTRSTALDGAVETALAEVEHERRRRIERLDGAAGRVARLRVELAAAESVLARLAAAEDETAASLAALVELPPLPALPLLLAPPPAAASKRQPVAARGALSADERDLLARLRGAA